MHKIPNVGPIRFNLICSIISTMIFVVLVQNAYAQRVGFISSDVIRKHLPEAQAANQRIQSIVEEWKRELDAIETNIKNMQFDIEKNRLIWSDKEKYDKETQLGDLQRSKVTFAKMKFEAGGEYDVTVETIMKPVEEKIYAAVQQVSAEEKFDIIWDKSVMPLPYVNFKFDLTVKVLKKLDVDVKELEKELEQKIDKDPRNKEKDTRTAPKRKSRTRSTENAPDRNQIPDDQSAPDELSDPNSPLNQQVNPRREEEIERK